MSEHQVTPEQAAALKKLRKKAEKATGLVIARLFAMVFFFAGSTLVVGALILPNTPEFIFFGNFIGAILALTDAAEGSKEVTDKFREEEQKILRGFHE